MVRNIVANKGGAFFSGLDRTAKEVLIALTAFTGAGFRDNLFSSGTAPFSSRNPIAAITSPGIVPDWAGGNL